MTAFLVSGRKNLYHDFLRKFKTTGSLRHEKNISTARPQTEKHARISGTHGHKEWSESAQPSPRKRALQAHRQRRTISNSQGRITPLRFTLSKPRILRGYKSFTRVITEGKSISSPPIRCYYSRGPQSPRCIQAGFSVSRGVRRAVDRNKAKRLMRESYRLNSSLLGGERRILQNSFDLVFLYTGRSVGLRGGTSFADVNKSMQQIMKAIAREEM